MALTVPAAVAADAVSTVKAVSPGTVEAASDAAVAAAAVNPGMTVDLLRGRNLLNNVVQSIKGLS